MINFGPISAPISVRKEKSESTTWQVPGVYRAIDTPEGVRDTRELY